MGESCDLKAICNKISFQDVQELGIRKRRTIENTKKRLKICVSKSNPIKKKREVIKTQTVHGIKFITVSLMYEIAQHWLPIEASKVSVSFVGHTAHCGTESEHQVLNGSHIFISLREYWYYLVLCSNIHVKGDTMMRKTI